jgi:iron complex transport system permease protein
VNLRQASFLGWSLGALALLLLALGVCVGSAGFENLLQPLLNPLADPDQTAMAQQIVWEIRLPRTLGAWAAGALLGMAGALAQGLFRNPLADPFLLGSASGATLGVALALAAIGGAGGMLGGSGGSGGMMGEGLAFSIFGSGWLIRLGLTGAAFGGAVLAVLLTLALSKGVQHTLRLLLAGVVVGVVLGAMTHLVLLWTPESLQAMQAFMLGSTAFVGWTACLVMLLVWLLASIGGALLARLLDALSLGEATAHSLGLPLTSMRLALVAVLALATGAAVAQTGLIAFVGLAAPHLVRSVVKTTHGRLILLSSLMGGVLLMAADTLARWLIAPQELPVGVLTAVLGGGYLLWLMHRGGVAR